MHPKANTGRRLTKGKCRYSPGAAARVAPFPPPGATAPGGGGAKKGAGRVARRCRGAGGLPGTTKKDQNGPPGADGELAGLQRIRKNYAKGGAMTQNGCENNMAAGRRACGTNTYMGEQENT